MNFREMKISVIIPTYMPQSYLWECLESLDNQTFSKDQYEVILVLNGCCEPYDELIKNYINRNIPLLNVNYIHIERGGVSNARNIALDIATGEYITFIDDDDYVSPTYLEELYDRATPEVVSLSNAKAFTDGNLGNKFSFTLPDEFAKKADNGIQNISKARRFFAGPCMKLIHKDIISDRRFDVRFKNGEDSIYMFLISDKIKSVNFTSSDAVYYRRYRENSAVTQKRSYFQKFSNAMNMIWEYIKIYTRNPRGYRVDFFCTRILGTLKSILIIS